MADPITREQVERAIPESLACHAQGINAVLGALWYQRHDIPEDVIAGWNAIGYRDLTAALTRWRDELAAAEPVRRVARWDADLDAYALTPIHDDGACFTCGGALMTHAAEDAAQAIAWGYEIEGGPEPIDDSSPERLRERREALGWNQTWAAEDINRLHGFTEDPWGWRCVASCEDGSASAIDRARYAAALSAAEAERAAKLDHLAYTDSPAWDEPAYSTLRQPAPDVVDVPQPVVKLSGDTEARWNGPGTILVRFTGPTYPGKASLTVPIPLLRAMLEAIDAQQGGA